MLEMLFRPPSMVCRIAVPSLALRTPCCSSATLERKPLATARPRRVVARLVDAKAGGQLGDGVVQRSWYSFARFC